MNASSQSERIANIQKARVHYETRKDRRTRQLWYVREFGTCGSMIPAPSKGAKNAEPVRFQLGHPFA